MHTYIYNYILTPTHFLVMAFSIINFDCLSSHTSRYTSLSNLFISNRLLPIVNTSCYLPGLKRAGSIRSGLLVAPITNTSCFLSNPSNSANN